MYVVNILSVIVSKSELNGFVKVRDEVSLTKKTRWEVRRLYVTCLKVFIDA